MRRMPPVRQRSTTECGSTVWLLLLTNLLVFQVTWYLRGGRDDTSEQLLKFESRRTRDLGLPSTFSSSSEQELSTDGNILMPRKGKAVALPSVRVAKEEFASNEIYGGKGDKPHLGGFTDLDHHGVSPATWKWMVQYIGVHSVLDVGCGRGISTSWFHFHGVDILCVEGSHDAVENSVLPDPGNQIVEHDFSRGPWWPEKTYDAVWCVEFMEHVGRNLQQNYIPAFRKAALIFATHSNWGGHHHVEVHDEDFWIQKMTMFGFVYSESLTKKARAAASAEREIAQKNTGKVVAPNGVPLNAQHIWTALKVFINPAVAALPQHAHLLAEPGCFDKKLKGETRINRECGTGPKGSLETVLPMEYRALDITSAQDDKWFEHIKARVTQKQTE